MRKTITMLVLAIFLLSILPISLAENGKGENLKERLKNIGEKNLEKLEKLKEKPEWAKFNETLGFKARVLEKMHVEKARENYLKARERYVEAKANMEESKLKFQEQLAARKACKDNSTECDQQEEQLRLKAKEFLGNSADAIIEHLNKVKEKVDENEELTEEEANEMIEKIDAKIAEIQEAKEQAQNATTKEEIVEAAQKINAAWKNIKVTTELQANAMINSRMGGIIIKSENLNKKLDKIVTRMEENGKDVSAVQPLIDEYKAMIKTAEDKYGAATQKYKEASLAEDKPEAKQILEEASGLMKEAKEALKEANEKLRDIVKSIKDNDGEEEIEEENEDNETESS